ncbi:unnamed protein product [Trichogramma brassicae]|uniref:Caspase family p20 domain-containing protein n=1 Tax=Trichogramma brassicae TaxID=86971 RepID=A0A6H5ICX6_9HYME|nr:unnamed protein product [Trichogramma brassicae]
MMPKRKIQQFNEAMDDHHLRYNSPSPIPPRRRRVGDVIDCMGSTAASPATPYSAVSSSLHPSDLASPSAASSTGFLTPQRQYNLRSCSTWPHLTTSPDLGYSTPENRKSYAPDWAFKNRDTHDAFGFVDEDNYAFQQDEAMGQMAAHKDADRYNMEHMYRGRCVIFNHEHFDTGFAARDGSSADARRIEQTFQRLGFSVDICDDYEHSGGTLQARVSATCRGWSRSGSLCVREFAESSSRRAWQRQPFDDTKDNTIREVAVIDICDVRPRTGNIFLLDYVDLQYKPMCLCDRVRLCRCRRALSWSGIGLVENHIQILNDKDSTILAKKEFDNDNNSSFQEKSRLKLDESSEQRVAVKLTHASFRELERQHCSSSNSSVVMGIYVAGAAGLGALYAAIVGLGLWAALHGRKRASAGSQSHMILANRSVGLFLAIFSLVGKYTLCIIVHIAAAQWYRRYCITAHKLHLASRELAQRRLTQLHTQLYAPLLQTITLMKLNLLLLLHFCDCLCSRSYIYIYTYYTLGLKRRSCRCRCSVEYALYASARRRRYVYRHSRRSHRESLCECNRAGDLRERRSSSSATCVGDTLVHGTADAMFSRGLAWCQVPIGYGLSLLFGALLFAKPMRKAEYVTMLDPFQQHYGARVGGLMFLPALCGDLFWSAALLRALGLAVSLVAGIETTVGVGVTVLAIALYTATGGLYSLLWTSALQLVCLTAGLALAAPYAALHPAVAFEKSLLAKDWLGGIRDTDVGEWLDTMLLAIFGGIPWQSYFQRILSIKCPRFARTVSIAAMFGCLALAVPSAMIGIIARDTNWPQVEQTHGNGNGRIVASAAASSSSSSIWRNSNGGGDVLPMVLRYLTPRWVAYAGLGAIACGIMASADSSIFSVSSMFSRNVYKMTMRPKVKRTKLFNKCDIFYVRLIMRESGEKSLGIPTFVEYPFYDHQTHKQKFPFRSTAMLASVFVQLTVSFFTRNLLGQGYLPGCCDVLSVYAPNAKNPANGVAPSSSGAALLDCTLNDASPGHMSDATTLSSSRTDYDASSTDTQLQTPTTPQQVSIIYGGGDSSTLGRNHNAAHKANQALHNLRESMSPKMTTATVASRPGLHHSNSLMGTPTAGGQILGVKGLQLTPAHMADCPQAPVPPRIMSPTTPISLPPYAKAIPTTIITNGRLEGDKNQCGGDRSNMELSLNLTDGSGIVKKNIKGVKLIGMDGGGGGTLRRPSLQGTFSPTPSVEMVNIFDRRQSSGSFGPSSLSPIPGVEACKTHGTAMGNGGAGGHVGNEHCRIKRGIVRHHSFNDTGDRNLTTLARQPTYPSMPLNSLVRKGGGGGNDSLPPTTPTSQTTMMTTMQRRNCSSLRYSSLADEHSCQAVDAAARLHATLRRDNRNCKSMIHHGTMGRSHHTTGSTGNYLDDKSVSLVGHLLVSPTYGMYNSAVKTGSYDYFVGNDEAGTAEI